MLKLFVARGKRAFAVLGIAAAVLPLALAGCGGSDDRLPDCGDAAPCQPVACTASVEPALVVNVHEAFTNAPVAGATVTATDGDYTETLKPSRFEQNAAGEQIPIAFSGAPERPGTYTVRATANGHDYREQTVTVTRNVCHVNTQTLDLSLFRDEDVINE